VPRKNVIIPNKPESMGLKIWVLVQEKFSGFWFGTYQGSNVDLLECFVLRS